MKNAQDWPIVFNEEEKARSSAGGSMEKKGNGYSLGKDASCTRGTNISTQQDGDIAGMCSFLGSQLEVRLTLEGGEIFCALGKKTRVNANGRV